MKLPIFLALVSLCLITACSNKQPKDVFIPDVSPVLNGVLTNEATVLGQVDDIEAASEEIVTAVKGTAYEAPANAAGETIKNSIADIRAAIKANPASNVTKLIGELLQAIKELKAIIARLQKENADLRAKEGLFWSRILYGGGVLCTVGAAVSVFGSASIPVIGPFIGPRVGGLLGIAAATLFSLGYARGWAQDHPFLTGVGVVLFVALAAGVAYANKFYHREVTQILADLKQ